MRSLCKLSLLVRFCPLNTTVISHATIFKKSLERETKNVFLKTKIVFSTKQLKNHGYKFDSLVMDMMYSIETAIGINKKNCYLN